MLEFIFSRVRARTRTRARARERDEQDIAVEDMLYAKKLL